MSPIPRLMKEYRLAVRVQGCRQCLPDRSPFPTTVDGEGNAMPVYTQDLSSKSIHTPCRSQLRSWNKYCPKRVQSMQLSFLLSSAVNVRPRVVDRRLR
jgi:hypothetical protein